MFTILIDYDQIGETIGDSLPASRFLALNRHTENNRIWNVYAYITYVISNGQEGDVAYARRTFEIKGPANDAHFRREITRQFNDLRGFSNGDFGDSNIIRIEIRNFGRQLRITPKLR